MGKENGIDSIPYEVHASEELGRYLIAARDLSPGDLVLTERPLVFGPKSLPEPDVAMPCVGCYKPVSTEVGERCAKCGWPVCSGHCPGLTDPRHHGVECTLLSMRPDCVLDNMGEYYRHDALLPLRCILLQKTNPESWENLGKMQSHMEYRTPGTEAYDEADEVIVEYLMNNFVKKLDGPAKKSLPEITPQHIHRMCGIIDTNALEIRLKNGSELLALYTNTCLLEHSCIPNTKHTFDLSCKDKNDLYRITLKIVVSVLQGHHITTMYSHALWGTQARRQHLKDVKYFACKCPRCSDPTEMGTYLSAMKCLGEGITPCDGIHLPEDPLDDESEWACDKCRVKVSSSQVNMLIAQMQDQVENVQMMGGSVPALENLLCRLSTLLHPNHYHIYSIKHSLVQLYGRQPNYMSLDILDKKIKMCKDLMKITNTLDPGNARLSLYRAVLLHELHSALVLKATTDTAKTIEDIRPLLVEAKTSIEGAIKALSDDMDEISGQKLIEVLQKSKLSFEKICKERKIAL